MTRNRATTGTVVFVGAGPGDPGMLTTRAQAALAAAGTVIVDPDVSPAVQDAVRAEHPELELVPATGEPAEVAKAAVTAAKAGTAVVRLVAGDPYTSDAVVKEVLAVGRTSVPFDVVPGVATATAVPAYAEIAEGETGPELFLRGSVTAIDGSDSVRGSTTGPLADAAALGRSLAADLLDRGAAAVMAVVP